MIFSNAITFDFLGDYFIYIAVKGMLQKKTGSISL